MSVMAIYLVEKEELETIVLDALSEFHGINVRREDSAVQEYLATFSGYPHKLEYEVQDDELWDIVQDSMRYQGVPEDNFKSEYEIYVNTLKQI